MILILIWLCNGFLCLFLCLFVWKFCWDPFKVLWDLLRSFETFGIFWGPFWDPFEVFFWDSLRFCWDPLRRLGFFCYFLGSFWDSWDSVGILWDGLDYFGDHFRILLGFSGSSSNSDSNLKILWDSNGIFFWILMGFLWILMRFLGFFGFWWDSFGFWWDRWDFWDSFNIVFKAVNQLP